MLSDPAGGLSHEEAAMVPGVREAMQARGGEREGNGMQTAEGGIDLKS